MPDRFLDLEGKLKGNYETSAFGFGRRGPYYVDLFNCVQVSQIVPRKYAREFHLQSDHCG